MRYQSTQSSCAAAALSNATGLLRTERVSEETCMLAGGTTWDGTDPKGLKRAAKKLGFEMTEIRSKTFPSEETDVLICLCDSDTHYLAAQVLPSGRWLIIDGAHIEMVLTYSLSMLQLRAAKHGARKPFHIFTLREAK